MKKLGLKEKSILALIFLSIIVLSYWQIEEKKKKIQTEKIKTIKQEEKKEKKPKITISKKKKNFKKELVPLVKKVYEELYKNFLKTKKLISLDPSNEKLKELQKKYNVKNNKNLLIALKPHPISITLAQAAIESAWGTSRFFKEANNIFGVWSFNKNEERIAAREKRGEETIHLKKFPSLEEAIKQYYKMLSSKKIYFEFKKTNYNTNDSIEIAKKLSSYSEQGEEYTKKIISVLKYNNFLQYDEKH